MQKSRTKEPDMTQVHELTYRIVQLIDRLERPARGAYHIFIFNDIPVVLRELVLQDDHFFIVTIRPRDISEGLRSAKWNYIISRCLFYLIRKENPCPHCKQSQLTNRND